MSIKRSKKHFQTKKSYDYVVWYVVYPTKNNVSYNFQNNAIIVQISFNTKSEVK